MDLTSSLGRICLGENVYRSSSEKVKGHGDWNAPEYTDTTGSKEKKEPFEDDYEKTEKSMDDWDQLLDFNFDDIPQLDGEELPPFVCKIGKSSRNKKRAMDNLNLLYRDIGTSLSTRRYLTQEEAVKEALALRISQKFALLEEVRPVLKTMAYHDKYKKVLRLRLEDSEAFKGKDDPEGFIFPIRLEGKVGVTIIIAKFLILDIPIDRDTPIVVGQGFIYTIGGIVNTPERLFSTFDGICHQTFRSARSDVLRTIKSDNDDEEEYEIKRNNFGAPIYGPKPAAYLNCNDPAERSLALQAVINPFRKISVWEKVVSFLGSLPAPLQHVNRKPNYKGCYTNEEEAKGQWHIEIRVIDPYGNIFVQGLWEETMMKLDHQDPNALDNTKPWKRYCFHKFIKNSYYEKVATEMRSLEILGDTTQRDIEEILGDTTQRDIEEILGDTTQRDIEEILGDTTQRDIEEILPKEILKRY
ncbi:hypothetical protein Tco_1318174 [Tanacetum coccineum]